ncbi:Hpt domain-containing protein [Spirosoma taeanense]|uniref:Hpt domain-containing protein n=1 Tax=Spirosoma taeanense TaxID=2735870 RepID=A0A6M5Y6K3_9BACT|nr:Hpt domain-containing protein [Spirosoma taeanense]QJW88322.1 Hpt domain-containing protein [Spirosoma taeanense]
MALLHPVGEHTIDHERLNKLHSGDRRQIISVFQLFLDEVLPDFLELEQGMQQQQWPEVADMAHKIVPWVGMVGLTSLETELRSLEKQAKHNPTTQSMTASWDRFKAGLDRTVPLLRQELARME